MITPENAWVVLMVATLLAVFIPITLMFLGLRGEDQ